MKTILGLDLGTTSIGWALVEEASEPNETSHIINIGVRVNPLSSDEKTNFEGGKSITTNADRTLKQGARRSLQRYKLRRGNLKEVLKQNGFIDERTALAEVGQHSTFQTYQLRAKAAKEEITLEQLARVLLALNKKRGYKSNRKAKSSDEGDFIDGMQVAKQLAERNMTPGELVYELLQQNKHFIPAFYESDLRAEFDKVWQVQQQFYPDQLTDALKQALYLKNKKETWAICRDPFQIEGIKRDTKGAEQTLENYGWRTAALKEPLTLEQLAIVLQEINGQIKGSSGYLGAMGDRSKELYFKHETVGQYFYASLLNNRHNSLRNLVFYRQDYIDEFEQIWNTQRLFHPELTEQLKRKIANTIIFYQRPLKSQKNLISFCELEQGQRLVTVDGKQKSMVCGSRVIPRSSPLFQEFKIWQTLNNILLTDLNGLKRGLTASEKEQLFAELSVKRELRKSEVIQLLFGKSKGYDLNFNSLDGNLTQATLFGVYQKIIEQSGHGSYDFTKLPASESYRIVSEVFAALGISTDILKFDSSLPGHALEQQPGYAFWHLLYSYESDNSSSGVERLVTKLGTDYGFEPLYAHQLANVSFVADYGSLSAKALRKILPFLHQGELYSDACVKAGYNHSRRSLTREQLNQKVLVDQLPLLPKNSLRNPVVEKILNQMVNVVNAVAKSYGKPDEIRIELARELKKNAKEREELTKIINDSNRRHKGYEEILKQPPFNLKQVTRGNIERYKLYLELEGNGYHTLYSDTYIAPTELFGKMFDIEHIIPQAKLFDDSFANKTLELSSVNKEKSNRTAIDYIASKQGTDGVERYESRVKYLFDAKKISKTKQKNLLMHEADIPDGFIERDLRNSQYIARKATEMLEEMAIFVVPTTGSVTDRLRQDWQLIDVMKELNLPKYDAVGRVDSYQDPDGRTIRVIRDWTKRNDHRHHALDALTIAFTKRSYIQYLNYLNARVPHSRDEAPIMLKEYDLDAMNHQKRTAAIYAIECSQMSRDENNHLRFNPPMPLDVFRAEAKRALEQVLVSIKSKSKVVSKNTNRIATRSGVKRIEQLTPRGQLHNETIYGSRVAVNVCTEKVGSSFTVEKVAMVLKQSYREALLARLGEYDNDPKKAFTGANSLQKKPLYLDDLHTQFVPQQVTLGVPTQQYSIRKAIDEKLKIENVLDGQMRSILRKRLDAYGGDARKAFTNLNENPIWVNQERGLCVKRVKVKGMINVLPLHTKCNHLGVPILDSDGNLQPVDFVSTSNNHHIAIFEDAAGNLQEHVVSFLEATTRATQGLPVVDRNYRLDEGWKFLFTMKINEYFVFPEYGSDSDGTDEEKVTLFDPSEVDLLNGANRALISPHLFRVQKLASHNYLFAHHLETQAINNEILLNNKVMVGKQFYIIQSSKNLRGIVKVRVDHLGNIVHVGEY